MAVSGVILAAGSSSRLGRPKQLLELDGDPIVRIVVETAAQSRLSEVILVVGAHAAEVILAAEGYGHSVVVNPVFEDGQSTSMHAGLRAVSPNAGAVLFLLGDQPEVDVAVIDAIVAEFERTGAPIVQPVYGGTPGNPVLLARELFPDLMAITGDQGARSLIQRRANDVVRVKVSDGSPPGDVDTDEDYRALMRRWANRNP